jgi:6-phosphofructokinase 1
MQTIRPKSLGAAALAVRTLGEREVSSPLGLSASGSEDVANYVSDGARVVLDAEVNVAEPAAPPILFEKAGPRERLFFDPSRARAAIVTCGGLCPGINVVIRTIVLELRHKYGVPDILGFRYGYDGLSGASGIEPVVLGPDDVRHIHREGGSVLGLSRGRRDPGAMVDTLVRHGVDILFAIGGDGTLTGAHAIAEEIARRGAKIAVIGVPKTIDNDVEYVDKTFGYDTAVEVARQAVDAAHTEALGAYNGVGVVKLMGRDAGFIAAAATLASRDVNVCLIPEVRFDLEGPHGLLALLERRLRARHHAVVVVAEGCKLGQAEGDVGVFLRDAITRHMRAQELPATVKYLDPSYLIRSVPANAHDSIFCDALARHAVHAGMCGKTDIVIGRIHGIFVHVPLPLVIGSPKRVNPRGSLWLAVTEATGQPPLHA